MAVAPARKFTEAQLFFLEAEFNNGLTSTSMVKYGDRFRDLHEKTDLPIDQLQRWINNRSRGPRPTCFIRPNVNDDGVNMEAEKQDQKTAANIRKQEATGLYKKPPSTKCATGYAVFCGEVFRERKDEFKGMSLHERNKHAHSMWQELQKDEQTTYKEKAKYNSGKNVNIEEIQGKVRERLIRQSIQRIQGEMDFLDQFGCTGFALIPNTPDGLVFPGSKEGEQFLLENKDVGHRFSSFINLPQKPKFNQEDIRRLLNEKYRKFTGTLKRVEYEKFSHSFVVKGWPEDVPFMQPGRFSQKRIDKVMEAMPAIEFEKVQENLTVIQEAVQASTEALGTDEAFLPEGPNDDVEASVTPMETNSADEEEYVQSMFGRKARKVNGKKSSFVKKGSVIPIIPSPEDSEEKFYLFLCDGKAKTNNTIKGKWLIKSGERDFVKSRDQASVLESNVFVKDGQRLVLREEDFEKKETCFYRLTVSTSRMIETLFENLRQL